MILNGCYVSVGLFCTVCNDVYSKMFIFGSIMDSRLPLVMRSRKADLPLATRARKRELCLHRYVSRMTRTENFLNQIFFSPFYATLFIVSRKYFFGFSKSAPTPRYTILDLRLPPCNAISEGRPPLSNTSSEAGALPL